MAVLTHLNKYESMGRIIPYIMEKTCLKPPTRYHLYADKLEVKRIDHGSEDERTYEVYEVTYCNDSLVSIIGWVYRIP